jgi:hypothetical protein
MLVFTRWDNIEIFLFAFGILGFIIVALILLLPYK